MKKFNEIIIGSALVAVIVLSIACKKDTEPGPAGANGLNANALLYKQEGTTLRLSGNYYSDGAAFDNTYKLSYYASLDENTVTTETIEIEEPELRTSETETRHTYHIVRRDSLNNSVLSFDILFYEGDDEPYLRNLNIDIVTDITSAGHKRIATGWVYNPSVSGPTANGYFQRNYLEAYEIENEDNSLAISDWNYNATTKNLSFEFSGTLADRFNSTRSTLTIDAQVSATLGNETFRKGEE